MRRIFGCLRINSTIQHIPVRIISTRERQGRPGLLCLVQYYVVCLPLHDNGTTAKLTAVVTKHGQWLYMYDRAIRCATS